MTTDQGKGHSSDRLLNLLLRDLLLDLGLDELGFLGGVLRHGLIGAKVRAPSWQISLPRQDSFGWLRTSLIFLRPVGHSREGRFFRLQGQGLLLLLESLHLGYH